MRATRLERVFQRRLPRAFSQRDSLRARARARACRRRHHSSSSSDDARAPRPRAMTAGIRRVLARAGEPAGAGALAGAPVEVPAEAPAEAPGVAPSAFHVHPAPAGSANGRSAQRRSRGNIPGRLTHKQNTSELRLLLRLIWALSNMDKTNVCEPGDRACKRKPGCSQ